jgi:penicillin-binding protein 2
MPLDPANDRRPPITPQLAIRVAGAGVVAFVLFGIIFFRLWYLQVLDGDKYLAQARDNRVRTERIQAPRGEIVDANNLQLVVNRKASVVSLNPATVESTFVSEINRYGQLSGQYAKRKKAVNAQLVDRFGKKSAAKRMKKYPAAPARPVASGELKARYKRLAKVLQMSWKTINNKVVDSIVQVPYVNVRVRVDVPASQRTFIEEHAKQFPGITVDSVYLRQYPNRSLAAQTLGTIGQITKDQLADKKGFKDVAAGTDVGQTGLELQYDQYLRGLDGSFRIDVNAAGERRNGTVSKKPEQGKQLKLTLHSELEKVGESALQRAGGGKPGAFVAMNPNTGAVYAMGSTPSYNPRDLNKPFSSTAAYAAKFGEAAGSPLINRADQSAYPTGSIFKPITALAALDSGAITTGETFNDQGCFQTGARKDIDVSCNAGHKAYGNINMTQALRYSSDAYFYNLGKQMYGKLPSLPLQSWAHKLGVARKTGIDLPYETTGTLPSPDKIRELQAAERKCRKREHKAFCGIARLDASWNPGDMTNFAVGQGGLQASPLQMAIAYSTIINNGRVPTPYIGDQVEDSRGYVQKLGPPASKREVPIKKAWRDTIMNGLFDAANAEGGTSTAVWKPDWPHSRFPIFGKTGTAERFYGPQQAEIDQSWYVAYSYDKTPQHNPIVVVVTIEKGGFGAEAAAPAARLIMSKWYQVPPRYVMGSSADR